MSNDLVLLEERLAQQGFAFVPAETMHHLLAPYGALEDWPHFAASWDDLGLDTYMADGGRYRKRRFGVFGAVRGGTIWRKPHQPHFQSRDYNPLNGGIERWFLPITDSTAASGAMQGILAFPRPCSRNSLPPSVSGTSKCISSGSRPKARVRASPRRKDCIGMAWISFSSS
jgi:hypothetical protein